MNKYEIRKIKIAERKDLDQIKRKDSIRKITTQLFESICFQRAKIVHIYKSTKVEVSTALIIQKCFECDKRVVVPVTNSDCSLIEHYEIFQDTVFKAKEFGIEVPIENFVLFNIEILGSDDLVVVPLVAFDKMGNRIGYGKGCYDRILEGLKVYRIGLAFDIQEVENILIDDFDVAMNAVIHS